MTLALDTLSSRHGVRVYRDAVTRHTVFAVDIQKAQVVPLLPTVEEKGSLIPGSPDGTRAVKTRPLRDFNPLLPVEDNLFGLISGTYGKRVGTISRYDPLPFSYKKDRVTQFYGYEMDWALLKRALVLDGDNADVIDAPAGGDQAALEKFLMVDNAAWSHVIVGHHPLADRSDKNLKRPRCYVGYEPAAGVLFFSLSDSRYVGLKEEEAVRVLQAFGVPEEKMVMFDGSGSAQAVVNGENLLPGDGRYLTNSFAVYSKPHLFTDVAADAWYLPYLKPLYEQGVIQGYRDGSFGGAKPVTRAEILKMCIEGRYGSDHELPPAAAHFSDVGVDHWSAPYVTFAYQKGHAYGYPDGTFKPNQPATRAETIRYVATLMGVEDAVANCGARMRRPSWIDVNDADAVFHPYFEQLYSFLPPKPISISDKPRAYAYRILSGKPDHRLRPLDSVNRAEAVKLVYVTQVVLGSVPCTGVGTP